MGMLQVAGKGKQKQEQAAAVHVCMPQNASRSAPACARRRRRIGDVEAAAVQRQQVRQAGMAGMVVEGLAEGGKVAREGTYKATGYYRVAGQEGQAGGRKATQGYIQATRKLHHSQHNEQTVLQDIGKRRENREG